MVIYTSSLKAVRNSMKFGIPTKEVFVGVKIRRNKNDFIKKYIKSYRITITPELCKKILGKEVL